MKIGRVERYVILTVLFLFQPIIERYLPFFKYYDEIVVLAFFLSYILNYRRHRHEHGSRERIRIICGTLILVVIGLIGNTISIANQPTMAIAQDIFSNCKFFVFFIAVSGIKFSEYQSNKYKAYMGHIIRGLFIVLFVCSVMSLVVDIGMTDYSEPPRFGLHAFKFLYDNPAGLNTYYYLFMIIHSITITSHGAIKRKYLPYTIMGIISWMLTLRSRAIAFAAVYVCLYLYVAVLKNRSGKIKFTIGKVVLAVVGAGVLAWDSVEKYFISNSNVSRYQLLHRSFEIAKDYFPVGSGFATFGTEASRSYYSQIYYKYGMSNVYGLSPTTPYFILDQFWFGILGQFGVIGIFCVTMMIFVIYRDIWKISQYDKGIQIAAMTLFYTSLFSSLTAGAFIQASILPSIMIFYILRRDN